MKTNFVGFVYCLLFQGTIIDTVNNRDNIIEYQLPRNFG